MKKILALLFVGIVFGVIFYDFWIQAWNWLAWQLLMIALTIYVALVPGI